MTKPKLDLHILQHPTENRQKQLDRLLLSLKPAIEDKSINVNLCDGVTDHVGMARYVGFNTGDAEYVTFADDDDEVIASAIQPCINILNEYGDVDAVVTKEIEVFRGERGDRHARNRPKNLNEYRLGDVHSIHHLVVVRRKSIEPYLKSLLDWPNMCEYQLWFNMIKDGRKFINCDLDGYIWHRGKNGYHNRQVGRPRQIAMARDLITEMMQEERKKHYA